MILPEVPVAIRKTTTRTARTRSRTKTLPNISSRAWEHPADRAALTGLRKVPGFDRVLKLLVGAIGDRSLRLAFLGSSVRVSRRQFPALFDRYREACKVLDVRPAPELFVAQTPFVNAGAMGISTPFIVLNSATLELLDEEELQFLLGHELGHVLSGHGLYKTMIRVLLRLSTFALSVPLGGAALLAIRAALLEWDRKSELSADRAGLLAVQDLDVAMRVQMKMAGGARTGEMDVEEFLKQAEEYEGGGTLVDSVMKLMQLTGQTHPFPVLRLAELKRWVETDAYDTILDGDYARRQDDPQTTVVDEIKETAAAYAEEWKKSPDPLPRLLMDLAEDLQSAGGSLIDRLKRRAGKG